MKQYNDISDEIYSPIHYTLENRSVNTIEIIEGTIQGLDAKSAYLLGNVLKYALRAGLKGTATVDIAKANNYAVRLVTGAWLDEQ